MSVTLSEKHGVNPAIPVCFWCGESKNEVLLLGRMRGDVEAPRNAVFDYEPCDSCQENMGLGITLVEITESCPEDGRMALNATRRDRDPHDALYPTGRWCVMTEEAVMRIFTDDVLAPILSHRRAHIDVETFTVLGLADPPLEA